MSETSRYAGAVAGTIINPSASLGAPDSIVGNFAGNVNQTFTEFNFELPPGEVIVGIEVTITGQRVSTGGGGD
jgi:hypothetical protein